MSLRLVQSGALELHLVGETHAKSFAMRIARKDLAHFKAMGGTGHPIDKATTATAAGFERPVPQARVLNNLLIDLGLREQGFREFQVEGRRPGVELSPRGRALSPGHLPAHRSD